eukprot:c6331_g1_i1.p1 GENE.c6331_g1_i1~~c6331_g1_i1.p1  ORF type:complete len:146 (-),score=22.77 c6331_g1_i1:66-503(-)
MLNLARFARLAPVSAQAARLYAAAAHGGATKKKVPMPGLPGVMPTDELQATGREAIELAGVPPEHKELANKCKASQVATRWGTVEDPVLILSAVESRIVGCTGDQCSSIHENSVLWWRLDAGAPHACPCGQVFKLVPRPDGLYQN